MLDEKDLQKLADGLYVLHQLIVQREYTVALAIVRLIQPSITQMVDKVEAAATARERRRLPGTSLRDTYMWVWEVEEQLDLLHSRLRSHVEIVIRESDDILKSAVLSRIPRPASNSDLVLEVNARLVQSGREPIPAAPEPLPAYRHDADHKEKIRQSMLELYRVKGYQHPAKGKKRSDVTRQRQSLARKGAVPLGYCSKCNSPMYTVESVNRGTGPTCAHITDGKGRRLIPGGPVATTTTHHASSPDALHTSSDRRGYTDAKESQ